MQSFFNKPSWATVDGGTGNEFYRRSKQTYSDIIAANQEARKVQQKEEKESESHSIVFVEETARSKRPRLSEEIKRVNPETETKVHTDSDGLSNDQNEIMDSDQPTPHHSEWPASARRNDHDCYAAPADTPVPCNHHTPSDQIGHPSLRKPTTRHPWSGSTLSGGEQRSISEKPQSHPVQSPVSQKLSSALPSNSELVVRILVTSDIPNTKPFIFSRKLSQGLRQVRLEWCKRQGLTDEATAAIYLTWRGRRLFDVTTCRSLGIQNEKSRVSQATEDDMSEEQKELRIHMEAVTDDPSLLGCQYSLPIDAGRWSSPPPHSDAGLQKDEGNKPLKIVLRSPGLNDLRIKARPKTPVSKLISAFREKHSIGADYQVSLSFDGDRLEPHTCLEENDIADLDMVEVQLKPQT